MHSSKYIQIRKERSVEQRLASIWLDACSELEIPCILIYQSHWNAYLSLNLKYIPDALAEKLDLEKLQEQLAIIQEKYTFATQGYCQHNPTYHTFDGIPKETAQQVATEIFDTIMNFGFQQANSEMLEQSQIA